MVCGEFLSRTGACVCGRVTARNEQKSCYELTIEGAKMRLGLWWIEAAVHGRVARLPIVNVRPSYEEEPDQ